MDPPNNNNFWGHASLDINDDELHAQNIDRIRIISTELLKLAQESQQQVFALKEKYEHQQDQLIADRNGLEAELAQERKKNEDLTNKLISMEDKLSKILTRWTELSKEIQPIDADTNNENRRKQAKF